MKQVLISIINYKDHLVTKKCLDSLTKIDIPEIELFIVIVNNDTAKDFTYDWKGPGEITILNHKNNAGFSGGHNISLARARMEQIDYVLILNNDTTMKRDIVVTLLAAANKHEKGGIFSPKIYFAPGDEFHKHRYKKSDLGNVIWYAGGLIDWKNVLLHHRGVDEVDTGQYDSIRETDFATGCCLLLKRSIIERFMFDERYFLYLEDTDLCERVKRAGHKIYYVPDAVLWHANAGSTGGSGSSLQDYFISRNRLLFGIRYAPMRAKLALLRESMKLLKTGREWQKRGIQDYFRRNFGKGSYHV